MALSFIQKRISELESKKDKTKEEKEELRIRLALEEIEDKSWLSGADLRRMGALDRELAEITYKEFVRGMNEKGFPFASWQDFKDSIRKLTGKQLEAVVEVVLTLQRLNVQASLVSLISITKRVYNATPLTLLYDRCNPEDSIRSSICDTISRSKAKGIDNWVRDKLANPDEGTGWNRLCEYAAKHFPAQEVIELIKPLEDRAPFDVPLALGICGGAEELVYLEAMLERNKARGKSGIRNEIKKAIRKIEKRLSKKQ